MIYISLGLWATYIIMRDKQQDHKFGPYILMHICLMYVRGDYYNYYYFSMKCVTCLNF